VLEVAAPIDPDPDAYPTALHEMTPPEPGL
jgi:hypothetical protein